MGKSPEERMRHAAQRQGGCPNRREFLKTCATLAAGAAIAPAAVLAPDKTAQAAVTLHSWRSASAISDVFAVTNIPVPSCSLASGSLPSSGTCATPAKAFQDAGVEALVGLMQRHGCSLHRTAAHPSGILGSNAVVVLKVNNQWGGNGWGTGWGRLSTNTDVLKGVIWKILNHPDGFTGEVVVVDNVQPISSNRFDATPANAEDRDQTYEKVIQAFTAENHPVSLFDWTTLNQNLIDGGIVGAGYPNGEYARGDMADGYILLGESDEPEARRLSYPKFQTPGGHLVSMRHGLWDGSAYQADRVCLINLPVLKRHGMAGCTAAWKNLIGFISCADEANRFGGWDAMHGYFWDYVTVTPATYGLLGRQLALIRKPDLHILDAIWVATENNYDSGSAQRLNMLLASRDPFALDWYASEYLLRPCVTDDPQSSSAARGGTFRSATRINQKAAKSVFAPTYPFMDFNAAYDGDTPSSSESNQLNAYVIAAVPSAPATTTLLLNKPT